MAAVVLMGRLAVSPAAAETIYIESSGGTPMVITSSTAFWTTRSPSWQAVSTLDDVADGLSDPQFDFVGDTSAAASAFYWANDGTYLYTRMRVYNSAVLTTSNLQTVFHGTEFVLIDVDTDVQPDYAFALDLKENDVAAHGLEMVYYWNGSGNWSNLRMQDYDDKSAKRDANDINGNGRLTDGYVRIIDRQAMTSQTVFGDTAIHYTTLIDFAVAMSYLTTTPGVDASTEPAVFSGQWQFQLGSITNANDHNLLDGDVAGGAALTSGIGTGYSDPITVPEPGMALLAVGAFGLLAGRRRQGR